MSADGLDENFSIRNSKLLYQHLDRRDLFLVSHVCNRIEPRPQERDESPARPITRHGVSSLKCCALRMTSADQRDRLYFSHFHGHFMGTEAQGLWEGYYLLT